MLKDHIKESVNRWLNKPTIKELNNAELGDFLYLAMGYCNGHKVVMGVGYTSDYAHKKAKQFEEASNGLVKFKDISVIRNGEKRKCTTISIVN